MKVGRYRRVLAFFTAGIAASFAGALVWLTSTFVTNDNHPATVSAFLVNLVGMTILLLPFVIVVGGIVGAAVAAMVPVTTGPILLGIAASLSGALTAYSLLSLMFGSIPVMFLVGACAGLSAALVWWRMVRAKELYSNA